MHAITLDGFYNIQETLEASQETNQLYPVLGKYRAPEAPLVNINNGATLTIYDNSVLQWNDNTSTDGGAIYNAGTLNLYGGNVIENNMVSSGKNGAGVYVKSKCKVQLSDLITINDNLKRATSSGAKDVEGVQNNVYLEDYDTYVTAGTQATNDNYTALDNTSKVGITKAGSWGNYYYAPVVYSDGGYADYLKNIMENGIITDDEDRYDLRSLNNTHLSPSTNYLYFVGTWVTEVRTQPDEGYTIDAQTGDVTISTKQGLAWAISVVNGENGQTPAPSTNFTLADDIDMDDNIWEPIGTKDVPYTGTFNGNGYVVTGLRSPLNETNLGMFGVTERATISDFVATANFQGGTVTNMGAIIGNMKGGTLNNVEAAGEVVGTASTKNIGGLVGLTDKRHKRRLFTPLSQFLPLLV